LRFVKTRVGVLCVAVLLALAPGVDAAVAGKAKLVEGMVYDGWCMTPDVEGCPDEPFPECLHTFGCSPYYKPFTTEGTIVNVRRRGSPDVVATVEPFGGYFQVELPPGRYVMRAVMPPETCTAGQLERVTISARESSPVYVPVGVYQYGNWTKEGACAVYPHP
jgi:hypothetical protein